jgi:hypothetical protein
LSKVTPFPVSTLPPRLLEVAHCGGEVDEGAESRLKGLFKTAIPQTGKCALAHICLSLVVDRFICPFQHTHDNC